MSVEAIPQQSFISYEEWQALLTRLVSPEFEPQLRRTFRRYPASGEVKARWQVDAAQYKRTWRVLEVSSQGLTLKCHEEIPIDTILDMMVNLDGKPLSARAHVVHCTQTLGGFKVGVQMFFDR